MNLPEDSDEWKVKSDGYKVSSNKNRKFLVMNNEEYV